LPYTSRPPDRPILHTPRSVRNPFQACLTRGVRIFPLKAPSPPFFPLFSPLFILWLSFQSRQRRGPRNPIFFVRLSLITCSALRPTTTYRAPLPPSLSPILPPLNFSIHVPLNSWEARLSQRPFPPLLSNDPGNIA